MAPLGPNDPLPGISSAYINISQKLHVLLLYHWQVRYLYDDLYDLLGLCCVRVNGIV